MKIRLAWVSCLLVLCGVSGAFADAISLSVSKGPAAGQISLSWAGPGSVFWVYRGTTASTVVDPANLLGTTSATSFVDTPPADSLDFYVVTTAAASCGNGILETGEQCDDGNLFNLDGSDMSCNYEVVTRMTSLAIQSTAAPAFCTPTTNRLGTQSFTGTALSQLNPSIQTDIDNGATNILTQMYGLDDLTGVADANGLTIGLMDGTLDPAKGAWPGGNPIDWWFLADPASVNNMGLAKDVLSSGTLAARALKAGPSDVSLPFFGGELRMRSARIAGTIDGTPAPNVPAPPPAQLASGLTVFQTVTASGTGQGLCGNITVESLAQLPLPASLAIGGSSACGACAGSHQYTYCGAGQPVGPNCNSLLDAMVGGCKAVACFISVINATQPDVAGTDGVINTLTLGALNKVPPAQTSGNDDAYSSYFKWTANRAHITGETCAVTADCQSGKTCTAGVCQ